MDRRSTLIRARSSGVSVRVGLAGLLCLTAMMAQAESAPKSAPRPQAASVAAGPAHAGATASLGQPAGAAGSWHYMVRSGDTLDRIIAQTQAASPFSLTFLRDAFARMNPAALPKGPRGPLLAGSLLVVPDAAALRRIAFPELEQPRYAPATTPGPTARTEPALSAERQQELEQRNWIRFP